MQMISRQPKGLTLVEILVVLGIIIALSAVALVVISPAKQRARSRDAVLKNSIASLGQSIDSFYGLKGYYPDPSITITPTQVDELRPYINNFTVVDANPNITITNPSVCAGGIAGGPITYYVTDFDTSDSIKDLPCLEALSNEFLTAPIKYIAWAPGYAVQTISAHCYEAAGYTELTGITP